MAGQGLILALVISVLAAISEGNKHHSSSNEVSSKGLHTKRTQFNDGKRSQHLHKHHHKSPDPGDASVSHHDKTPDPEGKAISLSRYRIPGKCVGGKMRWWINIKKKCQSQFGQESKWDRSLLDGWCREAWSSCNTPAYTSCCTRPKGPVDLEAYCADTTNPDAQEDAACNTVEPVTSKLKGIVDDMKSGIMATEEPLATKIKAPPAPAPAEDRDAAPAPGPAMSSNGPPPGMVVADASKPPSGLEKQGDQTGETAEDLEEDAEEDEVENRCDRIESLVQRAQRRIRNLIAMMSDAAEPPPKLVSFAENSSRATFIQGKNGASKLPDNLEMTDPDLAWTLDSLRNVGSRLLGQDASSYCSEVDVGDDGDDLDLWVNETKLWELMEWLSAMESALHNLDTKVHPHGLKWWRYRWEYTVLESLVLVIQLAILQLVMLILYYASSAYARKYHKTGVPKRFFRYTTDYFFSHGAAVALVTFGMWLFYETTPLFDWVAKTVSSLLAGRCVSPFLGESYYYLNNAVLYQIFIAYMMYAVAMLMMQKVYIKALMDWRAISEEEQPRRDQGIQPSPRSEEKDISKNNRRLYKVYKSMVARNVETGHKKYKELFQKYKLRVPEVSGSAGDKDFQLHLLLTDALGESMIFLTEVSVKTSACICLVAVLVGICAIHYKLAFMYLLIPFVVLGMLTFLLGWALTAYWRAKHEAGQHVTNSFPGFLNIHVFTRIVQVVLYWVFFSFSRLLFSFDIWQHYTRFAILGLVMLVGFMCFVYFLAAEAIKQTVGVLILPPHVPDDTLELLLDQNVQWQTIPKCPEFGTDNLPAEFSPSISWASGLPFQQVSARRGPGLSNRV